MLRSERALAHVASLARRTRARDIERLVAATGKAGSESLLCDSRELPTSARLTLNFHPDRLAADGVSVAEGLLRAGRYRSQWRTWISNGGRSAIVGGDRHRWEHELFGGAYDDADPLVDETPVYGSLDLLWHPHGGSPRFGSCYLVLEPHVFDRVTFTVGDSHDAPRDVGTIDQPIGVIAALAEQAATGALLARPLGLVELEEAMHGSYRSPRPSRTLDGYVEAQVHGGVDLHDDVHSVVLDPSFKGSVIEECFERTAERFQILVEWHAGSVLRVDDVPSDFRGPSMPILARRAADPAETFDARALGALATARLPEPPTQVGDAHESEAQQLKYLWHTLLTHGHDAH